MPGKGIGEEVSAGESKGGEREPVGWSRKKVALRWQGRRLQTGDELLEAFQDAIVNPVGGTTKPASLTFGNTRPG